ncbi:MAG: hypothetical protein Q8P10_03540 [bacterium]|nr:hypothetical protein [bacterium]
MKQKEIIFILVSCFLLVAFWVGFSIYHNSVTSTVPEALGIQITPIKPDFDNTIIENLKKRNRVEPVLEIQKVEIINKASGSGTIQTENASQSGEIINKENLEP